MRREISNSICGLLDYAAFPVGMLAVAPVVLRNLGAAQYGIWTIAMAAVNVGSILASGCGDACVQRVATSRGNGSEEQLARIIRASMAIHLGLGLSIALVFWFLAPVLANCLALHEAAWHSTALWCLRMVAVLIVIRSVETVCISTQRGFERYGAAVRVSVGGRLLSLMAAAWLASHSSSVFLILIATAALTGLALVLQLVELGRLIRAGSLYPRLDRAETDQLLRFGAFSWILSASGVVFSQCDRLIGGASVGASAIVAYALCAQIAQPVYGLTAAGLHFLFPYIAFRRVRDGEAAVRSIVLRAALANMLVVASGAGLLLALFNPILRLLASDAIARAAASLFPPVLAASVLLALTASGTYSLLALGRVRPVAFINGMAALAMLITIASMLPVSGVRAIIGGRLVFALTACLVYVPLIRSLRFEPASQTGHLREPFAAREGA